MLSYAKFKCKEKLRRMQQEKGENWKLEEEMILLGTDVKSLFPSLSAKMTGRCVRKQFAKTSVDWQNVDWRLVTLYVKLHEMYWKGDELSAVRKYLPERISMNLHLTLVLRMRTKLLS